MTEPGERRGRHSVGRSTGVVALAVLLAVLTTVGLSSCGSAAGGPVAMRVGGSATSSATVDRWARAIERGDAVGGFENETHGTARQRALAALIAAEWLRGQAAAEGVAPSAAVVARALSERRAANGSGEFAQSLHASGRTIADVELEIEAELAAAAIHQKLMARIAPVTQAEVADYYKRHQGRFRIPEVRVVDLVENLPSRAAAAALVSRIGIGPRFTARANHERLLRGYESIPGTPPDIVRVAHAIFAAPRGVASAPTRLSRHWIVFVVRSVASPSFEPLSKARPRIVALLEASHRSETAATFAAEFRRRWTARTSCGAGYVVPGCVQYTGPLEPSDPLR